MIAAAKRAKSGAANRDARVMRCRADECERHCHRNRLSLRSSASFQLITGAGFLSMKPGAVGSIGLNQPMATTFTAEVFPRGDATSKI